MVQYGSQWIKDTPKESRHLIRVQSLKWWEFLLGALFFWVEQGSPLYAEDVEIGHGLKCGRCQLESKIPGSHISDFVRHLAMGENSANIVNIPIPTKIN